MLYLLRFYSLRNGKEQETPTNPAADPAGTPSNTPAHASCKLQKRKNPVKEQLKDGPKHPYVHENFTSEKKLNRLEGYARRDLHLGRAYSEAKTEPKGRIPTAERDS